MILRYISHEMDAAQSPSTEDSQAGGRMARRRNRRSTQHGRGPLNQTLHWIDGYAAQAASVGLFVLVLGSALALGSVHRPVLLLVCALTAVFTLVATRSDKWSWSPLTSVALVLAAYSFLQSLPMPLAWLERLSPNVARVWESVLIPFKEPALRFGSLSLDPGASRIEALKWATYGLVASLAATVERRGPRYSVPLIVVTSAVLVALVTLVHWLLGAEELYGFYHPRASGVISPFINANNLAGYLNFGFFCGLACMLARESVAPRWLLAMFLAGVMAVSALLASRGGLMSLAAGLLVFSLGMVVRYARSRREMARADGLLVISCTIVGGVALLWMAMAPGTFERLLSEGTEKIDLLSWTPALILDHPWFGVGRGAFETAFPPYHGGRGHLIYAHAENFVLQWVAEWGIPVTAVALLTLLWQLRPSRSRIGVRSASATVGLGVGVLLLHNLVDLALEVPAVGLAVAAVLGALLAQEHELRAKEATPSKIPAWARRALPVGIFLVAFVTALATGPSALADRDELHRRYQSLTWADPTETSKFRQSLRAAMLSHPGDAYLPLLGGLAARRAKTGSPLLWASRALERDPRNSRNHLFIAELLQARGASDQALLHLRFATEFETQASELAAKHAVQWSRDASQLYRAVPEGAVGTTVLADMARLVANTRFANMRLALLTEAVARDPNNYDARQTRAWDMVAVLSDRARNPGPDEKTCVRIIGEDARAMRRIAPNKSAAVEVRALTLLALNRAEEGLTLLEEGCGATSSLSCYSRWLEVASKATDEKRLERAVTAFLTASCVGAQGCAEGELQVGGTFAGKGRWARAFRHYQNAANVQSTTDAWLRVAQAAEQVGATHAVARALRNAAREAESTDPHRKQEIEAKYQAIMGEVLQAR